MVFEHSPSLKKKKKKSHQLECNYFVKALRWEINNCCTAGWWGCGTGTGSQTRGTAWGQLQGEVWAGAFAGGSTPGSGHAAGTQLAQGSAPGLLNSQLHSFPTRGRQRFMPSLRRRALAFLASCPRGAASHGFVLACFHLARQCFRGLALTPAGEAGRSCPLPLHCQALLVARASPARSAGRGHGPALARPSQPSRTGTAQRTAQRCLKAEVIFEKRETERTDSNWAKAAVCNIVTNIGNKFFTTSHSKNVNGLHWNKKTHRECYLFLYSINYKHKETKLDTHGLQVQFNTKIWIQHKLRNSQITECQVSGGYIGRIVSLC